MGIPWGIDLCVCWYRGITSAGILVGISLQAPWNYFLLAPVQIAFVIHDPWRFLLGDSSLFSPVGVYLNSLFARNSVFPRRGFTVLLLSWGTPLVL